MRSILLLALFLVALFTSSLAAAESTLRFGVISLNHPLVMYRQYLPFTRYLGAKLGRNVDLVLVKDYEELLEALAGDRVDLVLLAGVTWLAAKEQSLILLCAVKGQDGTTTSRSCLIARDDRDDISKVSDVRGKHFAFGSKYSTSSYLEALGLLAEHDVYPRHFSRQEHFATQDAVVRAVLRGEVDAGAVSDANLARFAGTGLKQLAVSPAFPGFAIAARRGLPAPLREQLRKILLALDYSEPAAAQSSPRWSPLLRHGFGAVEEDFYAPIRTLQQHLTRQGLYTPPPGASGRRP